MKIHKTYNISVGNKLGSKLKTFGLILLFSFAIIQDQFADTQSDATTVYDAITANPNTKIFAWAIAQNDFSKYLSSYMSNFYIFVPTDTVFTNYIDPVAYAKNVPCVLNFWYNESTQTVNATAFAYDKTTGQKGDSLTVITNSGFISNRLLHLLQAHIIEYSYYVSMYHDEYYKTFGNSYLKITGSGTSMTVEGQGNINRGTSVNVVNTLEVANGNIYTIDKPIQPALTSVYQTLNSTPEFSAFFDLINGFPTTSDYRIFLKQTNNYGIDYNMKFFYTFNYTAFIPTNEAIQQAIADGVIMDWSQIDTISSAQEKNEQIKKLNRFIRYHFMDNSVFSDEESTYSWQYNTATLNPKDGVISAGFSTYPTKFFKLRVEFDGEKMQVTSETSQEANVTTAENLNNLMTCDYIFNNKPSKFNEVDGSGSGSSFTNSRITTMSTAVIHQIDKVLNFE